MREQPEKIDRDGIVSGTADRTGIKDRSRSSVSLRKRNGNQTLVSGGVGQFHVELLYYCGLQSYCLQ